MNLGLLDLPSPLFDAVDEALAALRLPAIVRIAAYAAGCAWVGMVIYRRRSDQTQLNLLRGQIGELQQQLIAGNDDYAQTRALVRRNLTLSLRQLGLTLAPSLLASLPLLFVLPWLSNRFDLAAPTPGSTTTVCVHPAESAVYLRWLPTQSSLPSRAGCWDVVALEDLAGGARLLQGDSQVLFTMPSAPKTPVVARFDAFNFLVANPQGYLPKDSVIDGVTADYAERDLLGLGPTWLRGWPAPYFVTLVIVSLILRQRWRLR